MARTSRVVPGLRWLTGGLLLVAFVVVPFLLFGDRLELWSEARMQAAGAAAAVTGLALLAADVVLPVPSSFVLTALGTILGAAGGTMVGALGMTLGCGFAYALGGMLGPKGAERFLTPAEQARLSGLFERHGMLLLAACRAVPVLAEASILAAGILRLPVRRVMAATTAANIGVSGCYAILGAAVSDGTTFLVAFAASIALPALAMVAARRLGRREASGMPLVQLQPASGGKAIGEEDEYGR
jgi:uncharacterized membrane protein YdjX (TVP38/TMEM64 family)